MSEPTKIVPKDDPDSPVKPGIDVWIEGIDVLREFVDLIEKISVLTLQANDVIVLKVRHRLAADQSAELIAMVKSVFGEDRRVAVLDESVDLSIVSGELEDEPEGEGQHRQIDKHELSANLTGRT